MDSRQPPVGATSQNFSKAGHYVETAYVKSLRVGLPQFHGSEHFFHGRVAVQGFLNAVL